MSILSSNSYTVDILSRINLDKLAVTAVEAALELPVVLVKSTEPVLARAVLLGP